MSLAASTGHICMRTPELGSILLASTNPDRLRSWALQLERVRGHNKAAVALANKLTRMPGRYGDEGPPSLWCPSSELQQEKEDTTANSPRSASSMTT